MIFGLFPLGLNVTVEEEENVRATQPDFHYMNTCGRERMGGEVREGDGGVKEVWKGLHVGG